MSEEFEKLTQKLIKKRKIRLVKIIEDNVKRKKNMLKIKEELEKNASLGLLEEVKINKESIAIHFDAFRRDVTESFLLMESIYGADESFVYN